MQELKKHFITMDREYREGDVAVLRQSFEAKDVRRAEIFITALGVYEAELNGEKIGEQLFAPGYTYYQRRVLFQHHDVTNMLTQSLNTLTVYLGQGWYCGRFLCENKTRIYGDMPAVSWILELKHRDGSITRIFSDANAKENEVLELESPYEYAGEYDGEIYNANVSERVIGKPVCFHGKTDFDLEPTLTEVRIHEEMAVKNVTIHDGVTILDFGQNFAGIVTIDPSFLHGETVTLRHGELLNADGSLYTANLRKAKAMTVYRSGPQKKIYRPRFTYMGFRYVELSGAEYVPGMLKAYVIHTDMKRTGFFKCEHRMVQRLYENQLWGQRSNYVEVPTDCPQRDERMGYTGDGHVFALTGAYNYDTRDFWINFLRDLELGQLDNSEGYVCATVPQTGPAGIGFISMLGWGNAVTLLPELLCNHFGDEEALARQYESMKLFVEAEIRKMGRSNLWIGPSLGDWLAMGKGMAWQAMHNNPVSNAFIVHDLHVISMTAARLGKTGDAQKYNEQLEKTRAAYIKKYVNKKGIVAGDYQSAYIMALKFVIPRGQLWECVFKRFVDNVRKNGLRTGFFATEHLLPLLAEGGETKLAYDLLLNEKCPGWMYQIKHGATTTWERWDAIKPDGSVNEEKVASSGENMVSFNHYAFGSVGEFYYQYILGIKPGEHGFTRLAFEPHIDARLGSVEGSYLSQNGEITSTWSFCGDKCKISLITPVCADVILPDGTKCAVNPGKHKWEVCM